MRTFGFTLMEILAVVVIVSLLATLATTTIWKSTQEAELRLALAKCVQYHGDIALWMTLHRRPMPSELAELEVPLRPGAGNYLRVEPDPWGEPYRLRVESRDLFRICSNGPDRTPDTDDDICDEPVE